MWVLHSKVEANEWELVGIGFKGLVRPKIV